ncbi:arabinogalactan oligomer/maltooligosaccharide transport system permease protein [Peribacillus deserti]|uniref:Arabinogalactan oligomer/maltooligosaccharide transport system permease protein n=1 Tax=Peribacillus deserti TaxID=673318 RepID=A0ABS2QJT6_9BACI|nr:sugar ABC transporter permease [Peribacillus deserti]MBM7693440.1 arabinogalactan oligomer/maltooligosaccharide transport system permease protein [Peribacillus deserti]
METVTELNKGTPQTGKKTSAYKVKNSIITILIYCQLLIVAAAVLFPIVWIVGASFGQSTGLANATPIPKDPTIMHYKKLIETTKFLDWYWNTFKIAVLNMIFSVFLSTSAAYIFSRFKFKGKKAGLMSILILQMFPSFMGMIAIYILFLNFGLLNNHWGLVIVYAAGQIPFNTWLIKGYLQSVPKSLDESAMIDGATKTQIFFKIILPLSKPILTFVALTQFMAPWMDFILPRLLISSNDKKTLAIGLFEFINGNTNNNFTMFAAGAILVAVPITLLYAFLQKYLISGITAGANKG